MGGGKRRGIALLIVHSSLKFWSMRTLNVKKKKKKKIKGRVETQVFLSCHLVFLTTLENTCSKFIFRKDIHLSLEKLLYLWLNLDYKLTYLPHFIRKIASVSRIVHSWLMQYFITVWKQLIKNRFGEWVGVQLQKADTLMMGFQFKNCPFPLRGRTVFRWKACHCNACWGIVKWRHEFSPPTECVNLWCTLRIWTISCQKQCLINKTLC